MNRVVFFRIGWMKNYRGCTESDPITNGGSWPDKGETHNFSAFRGQCYGYVRPPANASGINLLRIDSAATNDILSNVTVVWIANRPGGGTYIVGWYHNATLYARHREVPKAANRINFDTAAPYFVKASATDCYLLDSDERTYEIPRGKGYPGRSNIFYADESKHAKFVAEVLAFIQRSKIKEQRNSKELKRQSDIFKRQIVEKAAVKNIADFYQNLGYRVDSVEQDNVGWDLTATNGRLTLHLEVKGLSGSEITAELTPNEYRCLSEKSLDYRLCIVCCALNDPIRHIFSYDNATGEWSTSDNTILFFEERVSARVLVK